MAILFSILRDSNVKVTGISVVGSKDDKYFCEKFIDNLSWGKAIIYATTEHIVMKMTDETASKPKVFHVNKEDGSILRKILEKSFGVEKVTGGFRITE